jgi:hypothetical protein
MKWNGDIYFFLEIRSDMNEKINYNIFLYKYFHPVERSFLD